MIESELVVWFPFAAPGVTLRLTVPLELLKLITGLITEVITVVVAFAAFGTPRGMTAIRTPRNAKGSTASFISPRDSLRCCFLFFFIVITLNNMLMFKQGQTLVNRYK